MDRQIQQIIQLIKTLTLDERLDLIVCDSINME